MNIALTPLLDRRKFRDPATTADGIARATVELGALTTLWFNTGSLCDLTCTHCYIESSPKNDRLSYLTPDDVALYLNEIATRRLPTWEIGFTGGEPFMNPDIIELIGMALERGFEALVLSNAMRPMMKLTAPLADLHRRYPNRLTVRVSLDHYTEAHHDEERGEHAWARTLPGLRWLMEQGICLVIAGRNRWGEDEPTLRREYGRLFVRLGLDVDQSDPAALVLFPEMDEALDVPEITTACWGILSVDPQAMMCATSRMVVKRKEAERPVVLPCTLLPYDPQFEMGETLAAARAPVALNHPHCARFCVLGGGSCSA